MMYGTFLPGEERMVTNSPYNKVLTNIHCWSHDGKKIVYDVRSDKDGSVFDGTRIEAIDLETGNAEVLYRSADGACCGVVTSSPVDDRVVFIHGPENPDENWSYSFQHRRGVIRHPDGRVETIDACNIVPPFTPGSLRGGSHVHVFSGDGRLISFTYNDHVLNEIDKRETPQEHDFDQRNIGVSVPLHGVSVNRRHPRNHDGSYFTVLISKTVNHPKSGSDEISRAYEEGWIGKNGYRKPDGTVQKYALAFLGDVPLENGRTAAEIFVVDLPEDFSNYAVAGDGPLEGTVTKRPMPPRGVVQRRLTRTEDRKYPGIQGVRHWLRSSPDGSKIAFLMKDARGVVQLWTVSPNGGEAVQWTRGDKDVVSAFSWNPESTAIVHVTDRSVCVSTIEKTVRLTEPGENEPLPHAVVFSPDGKHVAFMRNVPTGQTAFNQIFVVEIPASSM